MRLYLAGKLIQAFRRHRGHVLIRVDGMIRSRGILDDI